MRRKVKATMIIFITIVVLITIQLGRWQIFSYDQWKAEADQKTSTQKITSHRGAILAGNGTVLAIDQPVYGVYVYKKFVGDLKTVADTIAVPLGMNPMEVLSTISDPKVIYVPIKHEIDQDTKNKLDVAVKTLDSKTALPGAVVIADEIKRIYPNNELASQIIGYAEHSSDYKNLIGKYGIEASWDKVLQSTEGFETNTLDRSGNAILSGDTKTVSAKNGVSIELTIDLGVQSIAEKVLKDNVSKQHAKSGSVIVVNPQTGDILALANFPTFDPNKYYEGELVDCNLDIYKENSKCKPTPTPDLTNPAPTPTVDPSVTPTPTPNPDIFTRVFQDGAVSRLFEVGSIIKPITVAAGIEQKQFTKDSIMNAHKGCEIILEGKQICKWDHRAAPPRSIKDAIADSDNLAMTQIAFKLGNNLMYKYFTDFGLGSKVNAGIDGEESTPLRSPVEMNKLDLAAMSFGQSFNISSLQAVQGYMPLTNDGNFIRLHIIKSFISDDKTVTYTPQIESTPISAQTAKDVREILQYAVLNSSAKAGLGNLLKKYNIGGKSGTAQIPNPNGPGYRADKVNTSYIAFAPVDKPQMLMLVALEEVDGQSFAGSTAIPVWRDIGDQVMPLMNVKQK